MSRCFKTASMVALILINRGSLMRHASVAQLINCGMSLLARFGCLVEDKNSPMISLPTRGDLLSGFCLSARISEQPIRRKKFEGKLFSATPRQQQHTLAVQLIQCEYLAQYCEFCRSLDDGAPSWVSTPGLKAAILQQSDKLMGCTWFVFWRPFLSG